MVAGDLNKADVVAVVTTFRRIGWSNEPASSNNVPVRSASMPTRQARPKQPKSRAASPRLEHSSARLSIASPSDVSSTTAGIHHVSVEEILDLLINGAVLHNDPEKVVRWHRLGGWRSAFLLPLALDRIWDLAAAFRALGRVTDAVVATPELRADDLDEAA